MWPTLRTAVVLTWFLFGLAGPGLGLASVKSDSPASDENSSYRGAVFVEQQTDCMQISDIKNVLNSVLETREDSKFMIVTVVVSPAVGGSLAVLRVVDRETGEILLERRLNISDEECADAHLVLKVMLEQFLTGFPIEKWKEKQVSAEAPACPEPGVEAKPAVFDKTIFPLSWLWSIGLDSRWPSPSGDLELALGIDGGGTRVGLLGQLVFRAGWPHRLGAGRYLENIVLLSLGVRVSPIERMMLRIEIRAGAHVVNGIGYDTNYHRWLLMLEGQLALLFRMGPLYFGPEVGASPQRHTVYAEPMARRDLPFVRVGILFCVPLGKTILR